MSSARPKLNSDTDWQLWINIAALTAEGYMIWDLINPARDHPPKELEEPQEPEPDVTVSVITGSHEQEVIDPVKKFRFDLAMSRYGKQLKMYEKKRSGIHKFKTWLWDTVASTYMITATNNLDGNGVAVLYAIMKRLRHRLAPIDIDYRNEVSARYSNLMHKDQGQSIHEWIDSWIQIRQELNDIEAMKNDGFNFEYIANIFRQRYRPEASKTEAQSMLSSSNRREAAFSIPTLNGQAAEESGDEDENQFRADHAHSDQQMNEKRCLCDSKHSFRSCYYLIPQLRPAGWTENKDTRNYIDRRLKESARLKKAIRRARKKFEQLEKPAANHTISTDADDNNNNNNNNFVPARPPNEANSFSVSKHKEQTSSRSINTNEVGNEKAVSNSNSTGHSYPLRDSWVAASAADGHVCNDISRFKDFTPIDDAMLMDRSTTSVKGYGTAVINAKKANSNAEFQIRLFHTAYNPNCRTNLVSMKRTRDRGVVLDMVRNMLVKFDGTPICDAPVIHGLWVLEYNPIPASFSTKPVENKN